MKFTSFLSRYKQKVFALYLPGKDFHSTVMQGALFWLNVFTSAGY